LRIIKLLVIEKKIPQRPRQFRFEHAGGAEENE